MSSGIYKIVNGLDNKVYIGSGQYIVGRWSDHKSQLRKNIHHSVHLQRAWNKYGEENFKFEIIELIDPIKSKLIEREQYWIDYYKSTNDEFGYNINPKADSRLGSKLSIEHKQRISRSMLGKKHQFAKRFRPKLSEEHKEKIRKSMKNRFVHTCM